MSVPIFEGPIVFCDVDDTLVSWETHPTIGEDSIEFQDPSDGSSIYLTAIKPTIEALKAHKLRKHTIILWSQGGALWAEEVMNKLDLSAYVDACMSKPNWIYDDLPASEFIPEHIRRDLRK
jgi:FMN phosphatase YigB (HAD superfamily)